MSVSNAARRGARNNRWLLLLVCTAFVSAGPQCTNGSADSAQAPTSPSASDESAILADSSIKYESSGGIAGFFSGALLEARNGMVSVEYRPPFGRASSEPRRATLGPDVYLQLWREIDRAGVRSLPSTGEPNPRGADRIRNVFEARLGSAATELIWMDDEPPLQPPGLRTLATSVLDTARKAAGER